MKEINDRKDIEHLVNLFYSKAREDNMLGPIFEGRIQDRWAVHLETMYKFWESILLGENTYFGRPFPKHFTLPLSDEHFAHWRDLFIATVKENFEGQRAELACARAELLAQTFTAKYRAMRGIVD